MSKHPLKKKVVTMKKTKPRKLLHRNFAHLRGGGRLEGKIVGRRTQVTTIPIYLFPAGGLAQQSSCLYLI
eukprot:6200825-Ditylum_brightwellii.AAC.1